MSPAIETLFRELDLHPVLVDVGATGEVPALWNGIAPYSTFVGIGPSSTETNQFRHAHSIGKIVTAHQTPTVSLHLMRDSIYSSLLEAHPQALTDFLAPRLEPAGEAPLPATTLNAIVKDLSLTGIDWLHTNVNGVDVPVFQSLAPEIRDRVLALDSCLDVVNLYCNQQSGVDRYPEIVREGFWLSRAVTDGPVRMRQESLARLNALQPALDLQFIVDHQRHTPGWIFVRFFRTLEFLAARKAPRRDYALLWAFALIDNQFGFCTDLVLDYERRFGADQTSRTMESGIVAGLNNLRPPGTLKSLSRRYFPKRVRRGIKTLLGAAGRS